MSSQQNDGDQDQSEVSRSAEAEAVPIGGQQPLSSSVGSSQAYREPIRSFIQGTVRDQLGTSPPYITS